MARFGVESNSSLTDGVSSSALNSSRSRTAVGDNKGDTPALAVSALLGPRVSGSSAPAGPRAPANTAPAGPAIAARSSSFSSWNSFSCASDPANLLQG